ncbi:hypothetical protein LZ31DRAFT_102298 [Colletotrichum somersetense]|nr:hypothetical protein LZ31DRAFT_102298 [Colletotrichum somersetense]
MKGSANLPLPLRVHEAPRAGNKAPPVEKEYGFLLVPPRAQRQHSPIPSSRPVGGDARQSLLPCFSGDQTSQPDEEEATADTGERERWREEETSVSDGRGKKKDWTIRLSRFQISA